MVEYIQQKGLTINMIRDARTEDAQSICDIYNYYIENSVATFEEDPVSAEDMESRVGETSASFPWLVYENDGKVVGYVYADKWKGRCAYRYSVETTIYLSPNAAGKGIGRKLLEELLVRLRNMTVHTVVACIAIPNPGSIALHEKLGFRKAGQFTEVGWKHDKWIDVGYWELVFEEFNC
jgi:L-amino acid N-acyltransferase YncA